MSSKSKKHSEGVVPSERRYFTTIHDRLEVPDLIKIQRDSYDWLLKEGLAELFEEISPIEDFTGRDLELSFEDYFFDAPKFDEETAKNRNVSYEAALRVRVRLTNKRTGEIKKQEVYFGDFPLMTDRGTFIINGIERVIVSQIIRSPGVFFTSEAGRSGKFLYGAKIIPNRGAWLEFETDNHNIITVRIDRKRKVAATALLRAFGLGTDEELKAAFGYSKDAPEILAETIKRDSAKNMADGLREVYKRIRPGDLATVDNAKSLIYAMFFNFSRYDLGKVGRHKMNQRFSENLSITVETRTLQREDIVNTLKEISRLTETQEEADDIDHLSNRRIRSVGELVQNKLRIGFARLERNIKDRMSTSDTTIVTPSQLINSRPVVGVIKEFFMSSQLSQFMDQINPLAELEHKRRLSAMGPGGMSRERAGFDVRDVHRTHYGRICPITTPEGSNIGLVGHLASYAVLNPFGFIETPYVKVIKDINVSEAKKHLGSVLRADITDSSGDVLAESGDEITEELASKLSKHKDIKTVPIQPRLSSEIVFLDAREEEKAVVAAATATIDDHGHFTQELLEARVKGHPGVAPPDEIDFIDVSPRQIIGISTSLIPFFEHDDAVRALMGSNMQRQAVNLVRPEAPIVGTGMERRVARDSGAVVLAGDDGEVTAVDANSINIKTKSGDEKRYQLQKFTRSNASTCMNQKPVVLAGQRVKCGDLIADGPSTQGGELALGQNLLVAFMPWEGGNYEDAILISERLVWDDRYTSIHIENYTIDVRETKLGPEVVTNDIPNVSEEKLRNLDEEGIIRIGAEVESGDILVGKITPKGETELSAEERLLRAIFGEKAKDVRDTSLYLEHGERGKVVDIKIFSREDGDKLPAGVMRSIQVSIASLRKVQVGDKMAGRHGNKGVISKIIPIEDMPYLADGTPVDIILNPLGVASRMNLGQILETHLGLAAKTLGFKVASPVLDGVSEEVIKDELAAAGYNRSGQISVYDGKTGALFERPVTVGYIYMMKLNHMVEDKIHQRSTGPYSLVTQQPLGGKAQFGGQRFGEMEVWALEAYGAAHTLQEMLTIKSDDVMGRSRAYESIIKGEAIQSVNIPESFNVLVRELKGLCLNIELLNDNGAEDKPPRDYGTK